MVYYNFNAAVTNENVHLHAGRHCAKVVSSASSLAQKKNGVRQNGNTFGSDRGSRNRGGEGSKKQWWLVDLLEELPISFINISFALDEPIVKR